MARRLITQLGMITILGVFASCSTMTHTQHKDKLKTENFSKKLPVDTSKTDDIAFQEAAQLESILDGVVAEAQKTGPDAVVFLSGDFFLKAQDASLRGDVNTAEILFRYLVKMNPTESYLKQRHALELIRLGKLGDALVILEDVYKAKPEEDMGLILGGIYTSLEMKEKAQALYNKILKQNPKNEEACIFLSKSYAMDEEYSKADKLLIQCQNREPKKAIFAYFRGKIAMQRGHKKKAKSLFKLAMKREPEFFQATLALGLILEEEKNFESAKSIYQDYLKDTNDENFSILSRLVQIYFLMNDQLSEKSKPNFDEMVPYVEKLSSLDPSDLNLKVRLGILYADTKNYDKAIGVFKEILIAVPDSDKVNFYLGTLFQVTDELDSAVESFQKIQPASPLFVDSSIQIAKILNLQAQYKNSLNDKSGQKKFVAFVDKVKGNSEELHLELAVQLASYFESQLETKSAIKTMEEVMDFNGFVDSHIFYLAALYDKEKNYVNADRMILRILKNDPENAHALNFLGYSLLERNEDMEKAFEYISKAVKLKPQDGYIRDSLGWYYYKNGQLKKALVEIKKAWELVQTDVVITKHLAIIHKDLNNFEEAKKYYFKALAQCKNESERQEVIGDLQDLEGVRLPANSKEKVMQPGF
jgi:tetratricopeptide (TPR) repeat protein